MLTYAYYILYHLVIYCTYVHLIAHICTFPCCLNESNIDPGPVKDPGPVVFGC